MTLSAMHDVTAIAGVGHTGCFKSPPVPYPQLWLRACREAVADAGLNLADIDGMACVETQPQTNAVRPTPFFMAESLGIPALRWHGGPLGGGIAVGVLGSAAMAVATGQCNYALAIHTMAARPERAATAAPYNYLPAERPGGVHAYLAPYGYGVFIQYIASWYERLRSVYGIRREQIGRMVVDQRANAVDNPRAVWGEPLTLEEYLQSRWIAEPLCLLDADMPVAAAVAYVVTSAERARDLKQRPVKIANVGTWMGPRSDFVFHDDYTQLLPKQFATEFWAKSGFSPRDMSLAQLHDGFSIYTPYWLEALGFVSWADMGDFLGEGQLSRHGGVLPTNTHGGNLSEGRFQGGGHVVEAVLQLRGQAAARQVADAQACVVTVGGAPYVGAAVLHVT